MPMRPESGSTLEYVYEVVSSTVTSTQGLAVSFLLCLCNNDVVRQIKIRLGFHHSVSGEGKLRVSRYEVRLLRCSIQL